MFKSSYQGSNSYGVLTFLIWSICESLSFWVSVSPVLIGCYKSCDIRIIETLICLESSHWLNLIWHHRTVSRPNASTNLGMSVNASMAFLFLLYPSAEHTTLFEKSLTVFKTTQNFTLPKLCLLSNTKVEKLQKSVYVMIIWLNIFNHISSWGFCYAISTNLKFSVLMEKDTPRLTDFS